MSFNKNVLLEFRPTYIVYQVYPSAVGQFVKFYIFAGILDTKLSEKSNFETLEGVPTKARVPSKLCNHGNYG